MTYKSADVDRYLDSLENSKKGTMKRLRSLVLSTVPFAQESLHERAAYYDYHGALCRFAAHRTHFSFQLMDKRIMAQNPDLLKRLTIDRGAIRFASGRDFPDETVKRLLELAAEANEDRYHGRRS